ncbi:MAG TPA: hypothetical protein VK638_58340 [Edaphobacter sp.]|nr:hypothetical protein [Edaphobacter sp.]
MPPPRVPLQHVLFVGDSFTHGRYLPVRLYNSGGSQDGTTGSPLVFDENYGATGSRQESTAEYGPYGGIPGIFAELASEAGLAYDVHIEAISMTSLHENYAATSAIIDQAKWNVVVLQELSSRPLPYDLSGDPTSDPESFCKSVQIIEAGVHAVAPSASIYLYETWPRADLAQQLAGSTSSPGFSSAYQVSLQNLGYANHNAYYSAAAHDGAIAGIAPAGDAWSRAWAQGIANSNPFSGNSSLPLLWYGFHEVNEPEIKSPDYLHPSVYGAYLNGLVLFQEITGHDARVFGAHEEAAMALGISVSAVVELQQVANEAVTQQNPELINQTTDPCTITH